MNSARNIRAQDSSHVHVGNNNYYNHPDPSQLRFDFLRRLSARYADRKNRNPTRADGTCEWFTDHHLFRGWQNKTSALLWVTANPGCGKSVLAKYLIDDVLPSNDTRTTCYFFFKDDFEDQKVLECAICCILDQLFKKQPSLLVDKFLESFQEKGDQLFSSFKGLWSIFIEAAGNATGQVICVLDALDECVDPEPLAAALTQLYTQGAGASSLKFLVTSRLYLHIQRGFQLLEESQPTIHLGGEGQGEVNKIALEINISIRHRINSLGRTLRLTPTDKQVLYDEITTISHRTYLWVHLVFASIEDAIILTRSDLQDAIRHMPRSVDEAYNKILCKSRDPEKARKILHIIVAAERPLSLSEMATALSFRFEQHRYHKEIERNLHSSESLKLAIRETCGLFVVVQGSQVTLLHQTAREFLVHLLDGPSGAPAPSLGWRHSLHLADSHRLLSDICIRYLLLPDLGQKAGPKASQQKRIDETDEPMLDKSKSNEDDFSFIGYASSYWTDHYRLAHKASGSELEGLALRLCNTSSGALNWLDIYQAAHKDAWQLSGELWTPLLVASYFGLDNLVRIILQKNPKCYKEAQHRSKRTALSLASEKGHVTVVKELLSCVYKAEVILRDWYSWPTVVNMVDFSGRTPLSYAAASGHGAVVQLLLNKGAKTSIKDSDDVTPLWWSILNGHDEVIALLLNEAGLQESRTNILEMADKRGKTPLIRAAEDGNDTAVRLLLDRGAQIEASKNDGQTALIGASIGGHEAVVRLLLDRGAQIEASNNRGWTALIGASWKGHEAVVRLLLDRGAQIEALDDDDWTALKGASWKGHEAVVRLLLDRGAQIEASDDDGRTALMWASWEGHEAVVRLLLDRGAQIEASKYDGQTALIGASIGGHEAVVRLLLDRGAQIGASKNDGQTALIGASIGGHEAVVRLLLDRGAQIEASNNRGWTALMWASKGGHEAVVRLLLDRGAQIEASNNRGWTASMRASWKSHEAVVRLLLDRGAQIEASDNHGLTAVGWASSSGRKAVVRVLLDQGTNSDSLRRGQ